MPGRRTRAPFNVRIARNAQIADAWAAGDTILAEYMARKRDIPAPSPAAGRPVVALPSRVAVKLALYTAMRAAGVTQAELAARLGLDARQLRRMLDLYQEGLRLDDFDAAFAALGKAVAVDVRDAA